MDLAKAARLIGEPARAAMLEALLCGQALAAGELARTAGVTPATASEHLARLRSDGLVDVVAAGRHRYYQLASPEVAHVLETLSLLGSAPPVRSLRQSREAAAMRVARTCYDHIAGEVGVAVHDALVTRGALLAGGDGYLLSPTGEEVLTQLGIDVAAARSSRRAFARPCLDYTQRRPHLAGALGALVCNRLVELRWLVRQMPGKRALRITDAGHRGLAEVLGISLIP